MVEELLSLMTLDSPGVVSTTVEDKRLPVQSRLWDCWSGQRHSTSVSYGRHFKEPLLAQMISETVSAVLQRNSGRVANFVVSGGGESV